MNPQNFCTYENKLKNTLRTQNIKKFKKYHSQKNNK